jgi:hypothetical protein
MLTGLTKPQQIFHFFQNYQEGTYYTDDISIYICNTFHLGDKNPTDKGMLAQINVEVSSTISEMFKYNRQMNFERFGTKNKFSFRYKDNPFVYIPTPTEIDVPNPYAVNLFLPKTKAPKQTEKIEQTKEEEIISPVLEIEEDINDPIILLLERINKMNIHHLDDIQLTSIVDNKKITINITNA